MTHADRELFHQIVARANEEAGQGAKLDPLRLQQDRDTLIRLVREAWQPWEAAGKSRRAAALQRIKSLLAGLTADELFEIAGVVGLHADSMFRTPDARRGQLRLVGTRRGPQGGGEGSGSI